MDEAERLSPVENWQEAHEIRGENLKVGDVLRISTQNSVYEIEITDLSRSLATGKVILDNKNGYKDYSGFVLEANVGQPFKLVHRGGHIAFQTSRIRKLELKEASEQKGLVHLFRGAFRRWAS